MKTLIIALFLSGFCFSGLLNAMQSSWQLKENEENEEKTPVTANKVEEAAPILNADQVPWQLKANKEGIPIYTRKVEGSPILEYKANVIIDAPIGKAIALFEDEKQIPRWYFQCVHSQLVENDGPKQKVIYLILHLPWPVAPRDFVFKRTKTEDPAHGTISYSLTALPDRLPLVKGMIRVQSIKSIWRFKSLPKGQTELFFQQHTDPGGSIPASIINQMAVQTPFYSLKSFRKLITGKDA